MEKIINGVIHKSVNGNWVPYTYEELTDIVLRLQSQISQLHWELDASHENDWKNVREMGG